MVLPHKPGSLYKVLSRFYALGINLNKLESRPLPERDFEFMFYFDLETSVYSPQFQQLMGELPGLCEEFSYLAATERWCDDAVRTSGRKARPQLLAGHPRAARGLCLRAL